MLPFGGVENKYRAKVSTHGAGPFTDNGKQWPLFDLSATSIKMSNEIAKEYPNCALVASEVCDARRVPREDNSADAILLMRPQYHITDYGERIKAIKESCRLLKKQRRDFYDGINSVFRPVA